MTTGSLLNGTYQLLEKLGAGGVGEVYTALHVRTGAKVAVKLLQLQREQTGPSLERFRREALLAGSLKSAHIVAVLDAGTDPDTQQPFLVMEWLAGRDLAWWLTAAAPMPWPTAIQLAAHVCRALVVAHEAGVVHRDIKPSNIVLAETGERLVAKLVDFGIATASEGAESAATVLTATGALLGSPMYMAPEQIRGRDVDPRSDLWSLGVILFQALAGQPPHGRDTNTVGALLIQISTAKPPALRRVAPWVPHRVARVVDRLLSVDPARRFGSASELLQALERLQALPESVAISDLRRLSIEERRPVRRVGPLVLATALGLGAALVIGAGWYRATAPSPPANVITSTEPVPPGPAAIEVPVAGLAAEVEARSERWLEVKPPRARVTLDGQQWLTADGGVWLTGVAGSTHRLQVEWQGTTRAVDVTFLEQGGLEPSQVVVPPSRPKKSARPPTLVRRVRFE